MSVDVIQVSPDDTEESPIGIGRSHRAHERVHAAMFFGGDYQFTGPATTTSGTAVVMRYGDQYSVVRIVSQEEVRAVEDEIDLAGSLDALREARKHGAVSLADLKAELGL